MKVSEPRINWVGKRYSTDAPANHLSTSRRLSCRGRTKLPFSERLYGYASVPPCSTWAKALALRTVAPSVIAARKLFLIILPLIEREAQSMSNPYLTISAAQGEISLPRAASTMNLEASSIAIRWAVQNKG